MSAVDLRLISSTLESFTFLLFTLESRFDGELGADSERPWLRICSERDCYWTEANFWLGTCY